MRPVCRWTRFRLPLLAGDDLVGPERRDVERHLTACPACRQRFGALQNAVGILHQAAETAPVTDRAPHLWPDLQRQIRESRRPERASWSRTIVLPVATALAASLLTIALSIALAHRPSTKSIAARTAPPTAHPAVFETNAEDEDAPSSYAVDYPAPKGPRRHSSSSGARGTSPAARVYDTTH